MTLAEVLVASLGRAVAGAVLRFWTKNNEVASDLNEGFSPLLTKVISDAFARRRAANQFEEISVEIAERLAPFIEKEAGPLEDNERAAVALAVAGSINSTGISTELLIEKDLNPLELENLFKKVSNRFTIGFSEKTLNLYGETLREVCNYIVEVVITLPSFKDRATVELLGRTSEILVLVRRILDAMPKTTESLGARSQDEHFEDQYRREVARQLNWLELFGVDVSPANKRYALTVGYITLTASHTADENELELDDSIDLLEKKGKTVASISKNPAVSDEDDLSALLTERAGGRTISSHPSDMETQFLRVDKAIAGHKRHLLKGEAGSGKTTLLQWLAVQSAQRTFSDPLERINKAVPFFLQLRRFPDGNLPAPENYLDHIAKNLVGEMPPGWVHRQLRSGRALLLVDGVDEVPEEFRANAQHWIADLLAQFPDIWVFVTSRPPAVGENWLDGQDFHETELQPMTMEDIESFVDHWHRSSETGFSEEGKKLEVSLASDKLKKIIKENRSLRGLATSPLLCAMLCALHKERKAQLPKDRIELYRIALETLIDRRDLEREVLTPRKPEPTAREKRVVLQDIAYWYMLNGKSDSDIEGVVGRLRHKLELMTNLNDSAEELFQYLLMRSGVLREPIQGRVDFIHRTFQEYLAAMEVVEANNIEFLVTKGTSDQWREVIVLAAGQAHRDQREALLSGLIADGKKRPNVRHKLHLLAAACLETSPELSAELAKEIGNILRHLVPPKNISEAKALASAGELALPHLGGHVRRKAVVAAATVRAICLIGGEKALGMVAAHRTDWRVTVQREIIRGWENFDTNEYAIRVLKDAPLERGELKVENLEQLNHAHLLKKLVFLQCQLDSSLKSSDVFERMTSLQGLDLSGCDALPEIEGLRKLTSLRWLSVTGCSSLGDLQPLTDLESLSALWAMRCNGLTSFDALGALDLKHLDLEGCQTLGKVDFLAELTSLTQLDLSRCNAIEDPSPISTLINIRTLRLVQSSWLHDVCFTRKMGSLSRLWLSDCQNLKSLDGLENCALLNHLTAFRCSSLEDIEALRQAPKLSWLNVRGTAISNLDALKDHKALRYLNISDCARVMSIDCLSSAGELSNLNMANCSQIRNIDCLAGSKKLRSLDITGCSSIESLGPLIGHSRIRAIFARKTGAIKDSEVEELKKQGVSVYRG